MRLSSPRFSRVNKPALGWSINWASPLTRGLTGAFVLNENGGAPHDLIRSTAGTLSGSAKWAPGGVSFDNGTNSTSFGDDARYELLPGGSGDGTVIVAAIARSSPPGSESRTLVKKDGRYIFRTANATDSGSGSVGLSALLFDASGNIRRLTVTAPTLGRPQVFATTFVSGDIIKVYIDGVDQGGTVGNWFAAAGSDTNPFQIGGDTGSAGEGWDGTIFWALLYNKRALSATEIRAITTNPMQIFRPTTRALLAKAPIVTPTHLLMMMGVGG
jgi:hypothetical protein